MACQHQYLTATFFWVPVTIKLCTSHCTLTSSLLRSTYLTFFSAYFDAERSFLTKEFRFFFLSFVTLLCSSMTTLNFSCCKSQSTEQVFFFSSRGYALQSGLVTLYQSMISLLLSLLSHNKPLSFSILLPLQQADSRALYFSASARQCGCICPHPFCALSVGYLIQFKSFSFFFSPAPYINVISPLSPPAFRPACKTHSAGAAVL